jgi:hypothetical protein
MVAAWSLVLFILLLMGLSRRVRSAPAFSLFAAAADAVPPPTL